MRRLIGATMKLVNGIGRRRGWPGSVRRAAAFAILSVPMTAIVASGIWVWRSGTAAAIGEQAQGAVASLTGAMGLAVTNVYVEGRIHAEREDILRALQVRRQMPLLAFDPHAAKARLEAVPWIESASIERRAPDTIYVRVIERRPFALWQHDQHLAVIDRDGRVLTDRRLDRFANLLLLVGTDAPRRTAELSEMIAAEPALAERVTAAIRVGGRRWNLRIDDATEIKLPEDGPAAAWTHLAKLDREQGLLRRGLASVDMRLPDRLVVTLPNAGILQPRSGRRPVPGVDHET